MDLIEPNATGELELTTGKCVGPETPDKGESWFCEGTGTARLDPSEPFSLDLVTLCGPCASMRESKVIETNTLSVIESLERAA